MVTSLVAYDFSNKPEHTDYSIRPAANFDAYFRAASFGRELLKQIPETILAYSETRFELCLYWVEQAFAFNK